MLEYKKQFLEFLLETNALKFGEFKTKSGRLSPYFINTGNFSTGKDIEKLGTFYAQQILSNNIEANQIFGPAYKGVPLAVATSIALSKLTGGLSGYSFNRKQAKDHGESGLIVGATLTESSNVVIVDDVITAGLSIEESFSILKSNGNPSIKAIIVSVDRKEVGTDGTYAIAAIEKKHGVKVYPILNIYEILEGAKLLGKIDSELEKKIKNYLEQYGVKE